MGMKNVRIKTENDKKWSEPAVVIGTADTPRSYGVQTDNGVLQRNRRQLLRVPRDEREKYDEEISLEYEEASHTVSEPTVPTSQNSNDQSSVNSRSERDNLTGTRTRSGRLIKPPERLNL